jgi:uncharacterized protein (TIGR02996 family)
MPRYEFVEGTSKKFWEITLDKTQVRTRWGRIGTEGQEKEEDFDSTAEARKEYDKAIASKVKKGYQEVAGSDAAAAPAGARNPELEAAILADPDGVDAYLVYGDWLQAQGDPRGELVALHAALREKPDDAKRRDEAAAHLLKHKDALLGEVAEYTEYLELTWHLGFLEKVAVKLTYEANDEGISAEGDVLPALFQSPSARFLRGLTLGCVSFEGDNNYAEAIKRIAKDAPKTLKDLYIGDFTSEECELSWSGLGKAAPLWQAFPKLEKVRLRAGSMDLGTLDLPECRELVIETGGLTKDELKAVAKAQWPKLEKLELWFGDDNYGADCTVKDVRALLDGAGMPRLQWLGLRNADFVNELVPELATAKVLPRLKTLDLSMGVLTHPGAEALLKHWDAFGHLERLDLSESLLAAADVERLTAKSKAVVADDQRGDGTDEDDRYVAVGE